MRFRVPIHDGTLPVDLCVRSRGSLSVAAGGAYLLAGSAPKVATDTDNL